MAIVSIVLFVILLTGTVKTGLGDCGLDDIDGCKKEIFNPDGSTNDECRNVKENMDCLKSVTENCDNPIVKGPLDSELKELEKQYNSECGHAAVGQISSLFMCLWLASLAYFLTKFR